MRARQVIESDIKNNSWAHAYLFLGNNPVLFKELSEKIIEGKNCLPEDVIEPLELTEGKGIDIESIRDLIRRVNLRPNGTVKISVINNIAELSNQSLNVLLKCLEEPPLYATFLLFSKNDAVLPTIKSRCRTVKLPVLLEYDNLEFDKRYFQEFFQKRFYEASNTIDELDKSSKTEVYLDNMLVYFREILLEKKTGSYSKIVKEIEKAIKHTKTNANTRLLLECLWLKIKDWENDR